MMLAQFPFVIHGFHSDNGSEFITAPSVHGSGAGLLTKGVGGGSTQNAKTTWSSLARFTAARQVSHVYDLNKLLVPMDREGGGTHL
jgi:hypothetical protein